MKKTISLEMSSTEALELLTHPATSKKMHTKIIAALRDGDVTPKGALVSATATAKRRSKKKAADPVQENQEATADDASQLPA